MIATPRDIVLITTPQKYNNQIEIQGGKVIWLDTSFRPDHHVSISGTVEAVPNQLTASHYAHGDSTMDVRVGDIIYFNYLTIHEENLLEYDGVEYYQVEYFNIFAYKRDGQMHMTNSWVFVEPLEHVAKDTYGSSGLIVPDAWRKKPNHKIGILRHIGDPLKGKPRLDVKEGDYVIYRKDADFPNEIDGDVYYTMKQEDLFAIIDKECLEDFA